MIKQGILKNVQKFNNIKLAKGVDLHLFATTNREVNRQSVGISTESFGDKWFLTPKGRAIFKTFDSKYADSIRNIRIINELVCKVLCDQIGLGCAEYDLAHIDDKDGLLTYDVSEGKKIVNFSKFLSVGKNLRPNLFDCAVAIDKYLEKGYRINKKDIIVSMYKTILFDTLTLQTDRNIYNINFLYDSKKKEFTLAELIDNEFAFCGEMLPNWIKNDYVGEFVMHDIIYEYSMTGKILSFDYSYVASPTNLKRNVNNLVLYAKKHQALMRTLNVALNNIDINSAFDSIESKGLIVNKDYKRFVKMLVENSKQMIISEKNKKLTREELSDIEKIF